MPRRGALALIILLPATAAAQPQRPPDADAAWLARMTCDPMPPFTSRRFRVNFRLVVAGGPPGLVDRGEGRVGRDGALVLDAVGTGPGVRFTARYAGPLNPDGLGDLNGRQECPAGSPAGERTRPCNIKLWRQ